MGLAISKIAAQIDRSKNLLETAGLQSPARHYVLAEDREAAIAELPGKKVPPHIARTQKLEILGVEVRAIEVLGPEGEKE